MSRHDFISRGAPDRSASVRRLGLASLLVALVPLGAPAHAGVVSDWNKYAAECTQLPFAPPPATGKRPGPPGVLDIALVHIAMHDAVQAIERRYQPYYFDSTAYVGKGSVAAAAASAARGVLEGLYGANATCLAAVPKPADTYPGDEGLAVGAAVAAKVVADLKRPTLTLPTDPFTGGTAPGDWRPTPGVIAATGTFLAVTAPFALLSPRQFRPEPPPPLTSEHYRRDYDEVKRIGQKNSAARTPEQTALATFYSGNFILLANGMIRNVANNHVFGVGDSARFFALATMAAADSQITVNETKYHYNFWRPITAIRLGDDDGNPRTVGDANWEPQIATPPYPDHSSGANCLMAAITTVMQLYFGADEKTFTVASPVPGQLPRDYTSFSQLQDDIVEVRIYQGIHFRFADDAGRRQGARVGKWTIQNYLKPRD